MKRNPLLRPGAIAFAGLFLTLASPLCAGVNLLGSPFTPLGADFQLFALQGIDSSHTFGDNSFSPQINANFEFDGSTGVSYNSGGNKLTDFGIGLYNGANNSVFSTGVNVHYNQMVTASSVTITLEDFDIQAGKDSFFKNQKVEPKILLLGPGNTIYASATPKDIFPNLTPIAATGKQPKDDVWTLNFGGLLNTLKVADAPITGFILYADTADGEKPNSDPYLLVSVGNGIPTVPEPGNYIAAAAAILIGAAHQLRQLRRRQKAGQA